MRYVRITAPTVLPVSVDEVKANCVIGHSLDDAFLERSIKAATAHLDGREGIYGKAIMEQTWRADAPAICRVKINGVWKRALALDPGPVQAAGITGVQYLDSEEDAQTVDSGDYRLGFDHIGRAYAIFGDDYLIPATACREDAWQVTFKSGQAAASTVPEDIRDAIILMVADRYKNRENTTSDDANEIALSARRVLGKHTAKL